MWMVWNGRLIEAEDGGIPAMDRGVLLGDGVFDTLLAASGEAGAEEKLRVMWGEAHYARLLRHTGEIEIAFPWPEQEWRGHLGALVEASDGKGGQKGHWAIRTTITRGVGPRGIGLPAQSVPNVWMTISPYVVRKAQAARVVCGLMRRNESALSSRIKALGLLDTVWSVEQARRLGYDDVVFCNHAEKLACCSTSNVFWVFADRIQTPPLRDGVMDGVTRAWALDKMKEWGVPCVEDSLPMGEIKQAVAAFSTSSLVGIRSWSCLAWEGREYALERAHPWVERLQTAWCEIVC